MPEGFERAHARFRIVHARQFGRLDGNIGGGRRRRSWRTSMACADLTLHNARPAIMRRHEYRCIARCHLPFGGSAGTGQHGTTFLCVQSARRARCSSGGWPLYAPVANETQWQTGTPSDTLHLTVTLVRYAWPLRMYRMYVTPDRYACTLRLTVTHVPHVRYA